MKDTGQLEIRDQLDDRRRRLEVALATAGPEPALRH